MRRRLDGWFQKSLEVETSADCPLWRQLSSPAEKEQQFSPRLLDRYDRRMTVVLFRLLMTRVQTDYGAPGAVPLAGIIKDILDRGCVGGKQG